MGRKSTIERLPDDLRARIDCYLAQEGRTVDDFTRWLEDLLAPLGVVVSRSAAHRHMGKFARVAARLRESREMATALAREIGEDALKSDQGRFLTETLHVLINQNMMARFEDEGGATETKDIALLAKALKDVAQASRLDEDRIARIRQEVARETRAEAAQTAEQVARDQGLSPEAVSLFKQKLLGVQG